MLQRLEKIKTIDDELSKRHIDLDPQGYFIIYLDRDAGLVCAKHFTNVINQQGLAADPQTGEVINSRVQAHRTAETIFTAKTAKELCVKIFERTRPCPVGYLDHAAYLGREFMRAEQALVSGEDYVQD